MQQIRNTLDRVVSAVDKDGDGNVSLDEVEEAGEPRNVIASSNF